MGTVVYKHGGNVYEISRDISADLNEIIDFSANINPLGISEKVKTEIIDNIDSIKHYPDYTYKRLKDKIVGYHREMCQITEENIYLSNGAADGIYNLISYLKPKKALLLAPTFGEYEMALDRVDCSVKYYFLKEKNGFRIDLEDYILKIEEDIDFIALCNPNNPTGQMTDKEDILTILDYCREHKINVLLDEAFCDFLMDESDHSLIDELLKYNNMYILRSLTKFFAMPGLRLGYILSGNSGVIGELKKTSPPWRINVIAEVAAISSLDDEEYINKSKENLNIEKAFMYDKMKQIKCLRVFEPSVNYIFFKINQGFCSMGIDLKKELIDRKILIRSCDNYVGLDGEFYRVAIKSRNENEILLRSIGEIFGGL
jgi:threonine-phosphate decarboxylase